jgi:hypothetical protein
MGEVARNLVHPARVIEFEALKLLLPRPAGEDGALLPVPVLEKK